MSVAITETGNQIKSESNVFPHLIILAWVTTSAIVLVKELPAGVLQWLR